MKTLGRHLSNIFDHRDLRTKETFTGFSYDEWKQGPKAIELAWQRHLKWIGENEIGPPQATKVYTVEQLQEMGMIGIYKKQ